MNQLAYLPTPTEQIENYQFLQYSYPELFRVSQEVDQFYSTDHACCLLKARLFVELWCHEVGEKLGLRPPVTGDLLDKIQQISASNKVPSYIIEALHKIRLEGNKSVHITQNMTGEWRSDTGLSQFKLKQLMLNMFELAQYLAFQLNLQSQTQQQWQEPVAKEMATQVYASLNGNKEATYALAKHASSSLQQILDQKESNIKNRKLSVKQLQHDLSYWLDKAHLQGHPDTWLLYATVYWNKQLVIPEGESIKNCFKQALKNDDQGQVAYEFGCYLIEHNEHARGFNFIEQAAEKLNHKAICVLQETTYKKEPAKYSNWLNKGLEAKEKRSFTLDFEQKLSAWEQDQNNDLLQKKARSALITAQSRQAPGIEYYQAYCVYHGYWGKQPNPVLGLENMADTYKNVPQFLYFEEDLFNLTKNEVKYGSLALKMSTNALRINETIDGKALLKFDLAMLIWRELRDNKQAKSPHGIKKLLRESAKEGCEKAIQFNKSPKGKALLRDGSIVNINTNKTQVDRKKQKQAKKSARKAKRK